MYIESDENGLWSNFEQNLDTFDHGAFCSDHDNTDPLGDDNFQPNHMFGVLDELIQESEGMIEKMQQALFNRLDEIDYNDTNCRALSPDPNALFLTFNYTQTLNRLYSIPDDNILHIHHSIAKDGCDLVFGHGTRITQEPLLDEHGDGKSTNEYWCKK